MGRWGCGRPPAHDTADRRLRARGPVLQSRQPNIRQHQQLMVDHGRASSDACGQPLTGVGTRNRQAPQWRHPQWPC